MQQGIDVLKWDMAFDEAGIPTAAACPLSSSCLLLLLRPLPPCSSLFSSASHATSDDISANDLLDVIRVQGELGYPVVDPEWKAALEVEVEEDSREREAKAGQPRAPPPRVAPAPSRFPLSFGRGCWGQDLPLVNGCGYNSWQEPKNNTRAQIPPTSIVLVLTVQQHPFTRDSSIACPLRGRTWPASSVARTSFWTAASATAAPRPTFAFPGWCSRRK